MTKDANGNELKVGDKVDVYDLLGCAGSKKITSTIRQIAPMHGGGDGMLWIEGVSGAWHPQAVKLVDEEDYQPNAGQGEL